MEKAKLLLIDITKDGRFYCQLRYFAPCQETSDICEVKRRAKALEEFIYSSKPQLRNTKFCISVSNQMVNV